MGYVVMNVLVVYIYLPYLFYIVYFLCDIIIVLALFTFLQCFYEIVIFIFWQFFCRKSTKFC